MLVAILFYTSLLTAGVNLHHSDLKYYETIHADDVKQKIVSTKLKQVTFGVLGKTFKLLLSPKRHLLHPDFQASTSNGVRHDVDPGSFFSGSIVGDDRSHVSLHIEEDGSLTGSIRSSDATYHIEPSWRHFPHDGVATGTMIAYRSGDVNSALKFANFSGNDAHDRLARRKRKVTRDRELTFNRTLCSLLLVADYGFFVAMGGRSVKNTVDYLIGVIDRVNKIYTDTEWEDETGKTVFRNLGFVIKDIVVHDVPGPYTNGPFCDPLDKVCNISELLKLFSENKQLERYCLAHLFTDHKFTDNIAGIAHYASVCNHLNSGVSTNRNYYGDKLITRLAELVISHEFGHNWGADHDAAVDECAPGAARGGPYLMNMYSVTGSDENNDKFSPCSKRSIGTFLRDKVERCFSEPQNHFCGNHRVEGEEECDAGYEGDPCCAEDCTLRDGAICSDANSGCCEKCRYVPANATCRGNQTVTCRGNSVCTGDRADCPDSPYLPDETECRERGRCLGGRCTPYCETIGKQSCMCDSMNTTCFQCCRDHMNGACVPMIPYHSLSEGTPCMKGYCYKKECVKTMLDLIDRFNCIVRHANVSKLRRFLKSNIVGIVLIVTVLIWILAGTYIKRIDNRRLLSY